MVEVTASRSLPERLAIDAVQQHGPMLLAMARLLTLNDDDAQDLVQTTLEIAIRRLDTLREPNAIRSWLLRIETREALRLTRRLRRLVRFDSERHDLADSLADPAVRTDEADLRAALGELPTRTRAQSSFTTWPACPSVTPRRPSAWPRTP
jgi:RNA polymerase sigma-70 factor (ECF subfamily)